MAKLTLDPIGSFTQAAVTTINTNMDRIEAAVEKTLSRDGTIPNQMEADLDMNNQNIINAAQVSVDQLFIDGLELTTEGIIGPEGPPGPPGQIQSIVEGTNIEIDVSDPANPIISSTASGTGDMEASVYDPQNIIDDAFDRANHTGSQLASTISDFSTAADARISAAIGVTVQAYDADLTAWAAVNPSSYSTTAQIAAAYQPLDSDLTSWAGVTRASGFDTFAATPSSANLASVVTDETGSGALVFGTSPTIDSPTLQNDTIFFRLSNTASQVPTTLFRRGRTGPAAVQSGDGLGGNLWGPRDDTAYGTPNCAAFFAYAGENFTSSTHGAYFEYELAPIGGTTRAVRMRISPTTVNFPSISTTASAANAFLDSGSSPANSLLRSTSSLRYKKDVEPIDGEVADALLRSVDPIWYRSLADADKLDDGTEKSFYSFGAEHLAEVDPRLVSWGYLDTDWELVEADASYPVMAWQPKEGVVADEKTGGYTKDDLELREIIVPDKRAIRVLREGAQKVPDGINDRAVIAMLFNIVKRQEARIAALEASNG